MFGKVGFAFGTVEDPDLNCQVDVALESPCVFFVHSPLLLWGSLRGALNSAVISCHSCHQHHHDGDGETEAVSRPPVAGPKVTGKLRGSSA